MDIFHDQQDYAVFLYYLRIIFSPVRVLEDELKELKTHRAEMSGIEEKSMLGPKISRLTRAVRQGYRLKIWQYVKLLNFCVMPNHFHLIIFQEVERGIEMLMRRLATGYSSYYRRKYDWEGSVVQGRYNASCLDWEPKVQALAGAHYVERNPLGRLPKRTNGNVSRYTPQFSKIVDYPYSSLRYYDKEQRGVGESPVWLNTRYLVEIFEEIKENPNGWLEERVAQHDGLVKFILDEPEFKSEDVRLDYLQRLL